MHVSSMQQDLAFGQAPALTGEHEQALYAAGNAEAVVRAMAGCHTVIVPARLGCLLPVASQQKLQHVILLSSPGRCPFCCP